MSIASCLMLPCTVYATDHAAVIAALGDEDAECRYLLHECDQYRTLVESLVHGWANPECDPPPCAGTTLVAAFMATTALESYDRDVATIVAAIKAKHRVAPPCTAQCRRPVVPARLLADAETCRKREDCHTLAPISAENFR